MTSPVRTERHGDILVIISDSPPVNALGAAVRDGLEAGVKEGVADASIAAMVLRCDGRTFFAGADITEFGKPPKGASLHEVIDMMDASPKPIVAAIHGTALGGGCEVALACHYRVAVPSAKLGLPEVKLGLLPGAGGTQRLPRVVGVKAALEMIAIGDPIPAQKAADVGLVDKVVGEGSLEADAIAFAREIAAARPIPRVRDKTAAPDPDAVEAFRKANGRKMRGFDAPEACIACVVAASEKPFEEGMKFEREQFMKLMTGTQSA
ncbi:enoyl-CoA hydratase/isomerase family protein, partial [uncultured Sphingomonas sp.]|uniref:enoyl-CoA hydratase/isomerase family protein n=1 Tax=uncultured Sphingomonas sp. TaxID=158754 RepID=UPI00258E2DE9